MQKTKIAFAGETAKELKARFDALKKSHPHLSERGILVLMKRDASVRRAAVRLGFDTCEREVL